MLFYDLFVNFHEISIRFAVFTAFFIFQHIKAIFVRTGSKHEKRKNVALKLKCL